VREAISSGSVAKSHCAKALAVPCAIPSGIRRNAWLFQRGAAQDAPAEPVSPGVRRKQTPPPRPLLGGLIGQERPYRSQVVMQRGDVGFQLLARNLNVRLGCPGR